MVTVCFTGNTEFITFLLDNRVDINMDLKGKTPLGIVLELGLTGLANFLREKGAIIEPGEELLRIRTRLSVATY